MILLLPAALLTLPGCGKDAADTESPDSAGTAASVDIQWAGWTLDQYIEHAPCIFVGTCTKCREKADNGSAVLEFDISHSYKGSYDPAVTDFTALSGNPCTVGEEYLIFCGRDASVYSGKDSYGIAVAVCDTDKGLWHSGIKDVEFDRLADVLSYVEEKAGRFPAPDENAVSGDYIRSENILEIFDGSPYVIVAEITGICDDSLDDRTVYTFSLNDTIKGKVTDEQWIIAFKDSMKVGEKYLLLLDKPGKDSLLFTMSSLKSVQALDSDEAATISRERQ